MANITILGAGGFGLSLAIMCDKYDHSVNVWSHNKEAAETLAKEREHKTLLKDRKIPETVNITNDISVSENADIIIIAVPSVAVRETCKLLKNHLKPDAIVACVSKGFEPGTLKLLSEVMDEEFLHNDNVIISGPSHAEEVSVCEPTTVVAASKSRKAAEKVQETLMNDSFRIYVNDDVIGVELGAALKNVIALASGCCDGLGHGDNAKAALMTRGLTEIARLGIAMGAKTETFAGLSGMGDLIVTCTSMHSRNRRCGILIGQGKTAEEAIKEVGMTVEGYSSAKAAYELSKKHKVEMPIIEQAYKVLYENKEPAKAIRDLMTRPKRHESEVIWLLSK